MLARGDEMGRTQQGNNNAYCQDNEISWVDWGAVDADQLAFTSQVVAFRKAHPTFRRRRFFQGRLAARRRRHRPRVVRARRRGAEGRVVGQR
jgi:isoamylase